MDTVRANLESISNTISSYMSDHCLVLNQDKTQIIWVGDGGRNLPVNFGGIMVNPSNTVDILGVSFNNRLSPAPHLASVLQSARSLAGASRRLSLHLRRQVLQQVVRSLLVGKVAYACAVLKPRFQPSDPAQKDLAAIQIAINDCARAVVGSSRSKRLEIPVLLQKSGLPSLNQLIVEQIGVESWKAMNYECDGTKMPIGEILCPHLPSTSSPSYKPPRPTRANTSNCIPPPQSLSPRPLHGMLTGSGMPRPC